MRMRFSNWPWKPKPDYGRLLDTLQRKGDPDNVPFLELFADQEVIDAALDKPGIPREVAATDREALEQTLDRKISFWHRLGYDAFWQGAILTLPDMIRLELNDTAPLPQNKRRWVDEKAGTITCWADFERYPWPRAADADLYGMEYVGSPPPSRGHGHHRSDQWRPRARDVAYGLRDFRPGYL